MFSFFEPTLDSFVPVAVRKILPGPASLAQGLGVKRRSELFAKGLNRLTLTQSANERLFWVFMLMHVVYSHPEQVYTGAEKHG